MYSQAAVESPPGLADKLAFLARPGAYARIERPPPTGVERVETHMAWVFLTGRHAWKLKKPVRYGFLDFSTLEARRLDCLKEVVLNRRLAPRVYLGVVPLALDPSGELRLGGAGPVVDWLVRMRRLPEGDFLDARLRGDGMTDIEIGRVADVLAGFYRRTTPIGISGDGYAARLVARIREDVAELGRQDLHTGAAGDIGAALEAYVHAHPREIGDRAARVVDGHGDLRPEHICLTETPVVIDCLEFNDDFRTVDPLDELSFLAMECELLGSQEVGTGILQAVCERLGDRPPPGMIAFYASMRALLRARLALAHLRDANRGSDEPWPAKGRAYLELAHRHIPAS